MPKKRRVTPLAQPVQQVESRFTVWNMAKFSMRFISGIFSLFFMLVALFFVISFVGIFFEDEGPLKKGNVAIIPLVGVITTTSSSGGLGGERNIVSQKIIDLIKQAEKNDDIKVILFEIDSPGGSPVATYEIAQAIEAVKKPTVAVIREVGASGGYWVATAAKEVWANPLSITGSIGVLGSHLEFAGLIRDYNVTYRRLVAGKYKDVGSRWREMPPDEEKLLQSVLDKLHDAFIETVAKNRKLPVEKVRELATGFIYLGSEAKELGLVDQLGSRADAIAALEKQLNITAEFVTYKERRTVFDVFGEMSAQSFFAVGEGIGSVLFAREPLARI